MTGTVISLNGLDEVQIICDPYSPSSDSCTLHSTCAYF
jgi:hypothetical protein